MKLVRTIHNVPTEIHLLIFEQVARLDRPISVSPQVDAGFATLRSSLAPLYTSPLTLSVLPYYYSQNTFVLFSSASLDALKNAAGEHVDHIQHLAFPVTQLEIWYALLAGDCKGLRKVTVFEPKNEDRGFWEIFGHLNEVQEAQQGPGLGLGLAFGTGKTIGDADARRFIELLSAKRPEIEDFAFTDILDDGSLEASASTDEAEIRRVLEPLRTREPGAEASFEDVIVLDDVEGSAYSVRDWEMLWEQAVMDDMKAWARGADDAMRVRLRKEGWRVRLSFLRRLRDSDAGRKEILHKWRRLEAIY